MWNIDCRIVHLSKNSSHVLHNGIASKIELETVRFFLG